MQYFLQELALFDEERIEGCLAWFPPSQVEAIRHTPNTARRKEKTAAYSLLVEALRTTGQFKEMPIIDYGERGKPFLTNYASLHFNISHCRSHVAIAIHSSPVGVDIECRRKVSQSLIKRVCSKSEQLSIAASQDADMEFLRLWTRKEAYLKFTGTGIVEPLTGIPPQPDSHGTQVKDYTLKTHPLPGGDGWVSICY